MSRGGAGRRSRPAFAAAAVLGACIVLGAVVAAAGATEGTAQCTRRLQGEGEESTLVILKPDGVARGLALARRPRRHSPGSCEANRKLVHVRNVKCEVVRLDKQHLVCAKFNKFTEVELRKFKFFYPLD